MKKILLIISIIISLLLSGCDNDTNDQTAGESYDLTVIIEGIIAEEHSEDFTLLSNEENIFNFDGNQYQTDNNRLETVLTGLKGKINLNLSLKNNLEEGQYYSPDNLSITADGEDTIIFSLFWLPFINNSSALETAISDPLIQGLSITEDIEFDFTIDRNFFINGGNNNISGEITIDADRESVILEDININKINIKSIGYSSLYLKGNTQVNEMIIEHEWSTINLDENAVIKYLFINSEGSFSWITGSTANIEVVDNQGWQVYFAEEPQSYGEEHWDNPVILFEAGSGGDLPQFPDYPEFEAYNERFGTLYVEYNHRGRPAINWPDYSEIRFKFDKPEEFGADSYILEYSNDDGENWENYLVDEEPVEITNNHFSYGIYRVNGNYHYRLRIKDGPKEGYLSNEVYVPLSVVHSRFSGWTGDSSFYEDEPFIGRIYKASTTVKDETGEISDEYLNYQWYRVNPLTFEKEIIAGETDHRFYLTPDDAGYHHLLKVCGDDINIGGFAQALFKNSYQWAKYRNNAYLTNISSDGFRLHLEQSVPGGINAEDLEFNVYDSNWDEINLEITGINNIKNNAVFDIETNIPLDAQNLSGNIISKFWTLKKSGDDHHHGDGFWLESLPDLN